MIDAQIEEQLKIIKKSVTRGYLEKLTPFLNNELPITVEQTVAENPKALFELMLLCSKSKASLLDKIINNKIFKQQIKEEPTIQPAQGLEKLEPSKYIMESLLRSYNNSDFRCLNVILGNDLLRKYLIEKQPDTLYEYVLPKRNANSALNNIFQYDDIKELITNKAKNDHSENAKIIKEKLSQYQENGKLDASNKKNNSFPKTTAATEEQPAKQREKPLNYAEVNKNTPNVAKLW